MFRPMRWLFGRVKNILPAIIVLTVIGVALSYISVEFALASRVLLDCATGVSDVSFSGAVIRLVVLLALDLVFQSIYSIFSLRIGTRFKNRMQRDAFSKVMTRDMESLGAYHSGELINRLTGDIRIVSTNVIDVVPTVAMLVSGVAMSFIALLKLDLSLALMCIALGPVVIAGSVVYGRCAKRLHGEVRQSDGRILSFMQECIQNLLVIKAFGTEGRAAEHASDLQEKNYRINMKVGYVSLLVNTVYFVAMTAAYYVAVIWCARKIHLGIMTVGTFTAIIQLVGAVQSPFREISGTVSNFFATLASAERIMDMEKLPEDITADGFIKDFSSIEIKDMSFSYGEGDIFSGANLSIRRGDIIVIRGISGQGKSTLFRLLLGIHKPSSGEISVYDGQRSVPLTASARSLFAYVPQGNMIISGSIARNIAFFDENPDYARLVRAAECACIRELVESLPQGFDTVIGENGMGLSEGQVQRLAVARAIYLDAPIILLDEATSALDDETETKILSNIKNLKDKTCLIITHKDAAFKISTKNVQIKGGFLTDL